MPPTPKRAEGKFIVVASRREDGGGLHMLSSMFYDDLDHALNASAFWNNADRQTDRHWQYDVYQLAKPERRKG